MLVSGLCSTSVPEILPLIERCRSGTAVIRCKLGSAQSWAAVFSCVACNAISELFVQESSMTCSRRCARSTDTHSAL